MDALRGVAQAYIAGLKLKSIIGPKLGNIRAAKLTTAQVKDTSASAARRWAREP